MKRGHRTVVIQSRDLALLRELFESRLGTRIQLADVIFDGHFEMAKKRIAILKSAGFLGARRRRISEPFAYHLTAKGVSLLREHGALPEAPEGRRKSNRSRATVSALTIQHELAVLDVKAAFYRALRPHDQLSIVEFSTRPERHEFSVKVSGVTRMTKPDGFIRIREQKPGGQSRDHCFFLEVDRSTETVGRLVAKARSYTAFYRSGGFAKREGGSPDDPTEHPFRVCMVFPTIERRDGVGLAFASSLPPILTQVWLATMEDVMRDPLGPVWRQPKDLRPGKN